MRRLTTIGLSAAAAILGLGLGASSVQSPASADREATQQAGDKAGNAKTLPARAATSSTLADLLLGGLRTGRRRYHRGPGWTHAHVQRMARKRRNVLRNRRAQRRAGR